MGFYEDDRIRRKNRKYNSALIQEVNQQIGTAKELIKKLRQVSKEERAKLLETNLELKEYYNSRENSNENLK